MHHFYEILELETLLKPSFMIIRLLILVVEKVCSGFFFHIWVYTINSPVIFHITDSSKAVLPIWFSVFACFGTSF